MKYRYAEERMMRAQEFQENSDEVFSFRGIRRAVEDVGGGSENIHDRARITPAGWLHGRRNRAPRGGGTKKRRILT
jgi:hypothetical protein